MGEILVSVTACGVCRTDLHIVDGELAEPKLPLVLGHQIVGPSGHRRGAIRSRAIRSASPGSAGRDGECRYCRSGRENLCDRARFTGYDLDGGYAELVVADERFCTPMPDGYSDVRGGAAPLRRPDRLPRAAARRRRRADRSLRFRRVGAHRVPGGAPSGQACLRLHPRRRTTEAQTLARELGAEWAGDSLGPAPEELDAAIIFAPVGELVPAALRATAKGGDGRHAPAST